MKGYRERAAHAWTEDSVRLILTPSAFAKNTLFYVQEVGHFRTLPSYFTEREQLPSYLVVYTIAGKGRLTYKKKTCTLTARQVFFIDCMEYQYYASASEEPWEILWVHLNGQSTRAYYEQFAAGGDPVRTLPSDSEVPAIIEELLALHRLKTMRNEWISSKLLVGLLTELVLSGTKPDIRDSSMPDYIRETLHIMEKRYAEKLTLDALARHAVVNKYHLAKKFKECTGYSPGEYLIAARITRAKELLQYSDLPVSAIAERVGIDNVSHFIQLFKHRTGQTPLAFRRTWRSGGELL
jgi:AraC-like DNA-binding protein